MKQYKSTIAAISTPPGKGGVAIIRVSGDSAIEIAKKVFITRGKISSLSDAPSRYAVRGDVFYNGVAIDDGLATVFRAPNSYTGEDIVEIACHGGALITSLVLEAVFAAGAAPAGAGEFTRRAFINGKMTLTDTEAIGLLLSAKSEEQIKLSSKGARERLNERTDALRSSLVSLLSSIYARIDYPDEDLGELSSSEIAKRLFDSLNDAKALLKTYKTGKAIAEGVKCAIVGKPNAGKSTLYNLILGYDAAIVTDIAGTTRDVLSDTVPLGRVMLRLSDTAGVREGEDISIVERIGIERTLALISDSELIFALFDSSSNATDEDKALIEKISSVSAPKIAILTKCESEILFERELLCAFDEIIEISAKEKPEEAIDALSGAVNTLMTDGTITAGDDAIISSARGAASLTQAIEDMELALEAIASGMPEDAVSSDIELAIGALGELCGMEVSEAVVNDIFKNFCVGK